MVSNGRDVVRTDTEGRWRLPVAEGESIFVIKPPHWITPLGPGGVPVFSCLHQPNGSLLETVTNALGLDRSRMTNVVREVGSVGAASIPIGLDRILRSGRVGRGDRVLMAGVGAGASYGAVLVRVGA